MHLKCVLSRDTALNICATLPPYASSSSKRVIYSSAAARILKSIVLESLDSDEGAERPPLPPPSVPPPAPPAHQVHSPRQPPPPPLPEPLLVMEGTAVLPMAHAPGEHAQARYFRR
ncbi:Protein of unknown function [Gryllus bimaculatus]|nr:Protein of unknown function [Gryllus bimaculatus]